MTIRYSSYCAERFRDQQDRVEQLREHVISVIRNARHEYTNSNYPLTVKTF